MQKEVPLEHMGMSTQQDVYVQLHWWCDEAMVRDFDETNSGVGYGFG